MICSDEQAGQAGQAEGWGRNFFPPGCGRNWLVFAQGVSRAYTVVWPTLYPIELYHI